MIKNVKLTTTDNTRLVLDASCVASVEECVAANNTTVIKLKYVEATYVVKEPVEQVMNLVLNALSHPDMRRIK